MDLDYSARPSLTPHVTILAAPPGFRVSTRGTSVMATSVGWIVMTVKSAGVVTVSVPVFDDVKTSSVGLMPSCFPLL